MKRLLLGLLVMGMAVGLSSVGWAKPKIRIASKHFTEGYLLTELMAQLLTAWGYEVERFHGLGGTMVCFKALTSGKIDLYPEYTGTIEQEILKAPGRLSDEALRRELRDRFGLALGQTFGFNNTYAIALTQVKAKGLGLAKISDLIRHPELKAGFSYEFLKRQDGWEAPAQAYGLRLNAVGLEHGLAYEALVKGAIDLTDAYTTDAKIEKFNLMILQDDRDFFPKYLAAPLIRAGLAEELGPILQPLSQCLDERSMRALNARVELEKVPFVEAARDFLVQEGLISGLGKAPLPALFARIGGRTFLCP